MLNQPKILPSSDAEWKAYYERKCRAQEREVTKLRRGIDEALQYLAENENREGVIGAVVILNRAIQHPILRRVEVEYGGVVYTDDKPIHE